MNPKTLSRLALCVAFALGNQAISTSALAQQAPDDKAIEAITVVGKSVSYANTQTSDEMAKQQSTLTSVLAVIDNLPGVLINEGDTFGSDDWSTTVSIRGFQLSLDEQQIGITIDGISNGNSNYGGGAKANRYIDTENLGTVEVSQGTGDIASRSNEALGGTLNFTTMDPGVAERMTISASGGSFDAQKYFVRYETGEIAKDTYAWFSASSSENTDWVNQAAENKRDHLAAKFMTVLGNVDIKGYASWDDAHEDNYQRVSLAQFAQNPESDGLTSEWTGIPYVDQVYRKGWSTLRENLFGYLQAEYKTDNLDVSGNIYYHNNEGRGDWVPQYMVDVQADGDGQPHSELVSGNTVYGGSALGQLFFVNKAGEALNPIADCQSSITFPYGGAGPQYDPGCYEQGAVPVGSYRHTNYKKERFGFDADFAWFTQIQGMDNTLRGGVWYEDYNRQESRDWAKIIDSRSSYEFDHTPYWVQYDREFPVETLMVYAQDELDMGWATVSLGAKQFFVDLERQDNFDNTNTAKVNSDSDTLLSAGIVVPMPVDGLELFAGYADNFAAIKDGVLERDSSTLTSVKPETAQNIDLGLRFVSRDINASLTYYTIKFDDRLTFIAPDSPEGINYLIGTNGSYVNVGGVESSGLEASLSVNVSDSLSIYGSYTYNNSEYTEGSIEFPAGNTVFGSPENMAVVSADWTRGNYFMGASTKWVDDRFIDAANTQVAPAYIVTDLYAGVSIDKPVQGMDSLELRFTVNNTFDESYLGGIAGQSAWIGAPRTAAFNATARF
ncbi:MAG: iron complex outermembrane receptor protein [Paraglaciecola sp.]|jgi:iron complex outermembrane receptor protein